MTEQAEPLAHIDAALSALDGHPYLNHPVPASWIKLGTHEARLAQAALREARAEIVRLSALIPEPPADGRRVEREALIQALIRAVPGHVSGEGIRIDATEIWRRTLASADALMASPEWRNRGPVLTPQEIETLQDAAGTSYNEGFEEEAAAVRAIIDRLTGSSSQTIDAQDA